MVEKDFLENSKKREENMNRVEVLDQVKILLSLPNTELYTTEMVANYYEVGINAIYSLIHDNQDEIKNNGYKVVNGKELTSLKKVCQIRSNAKQLATFTKRTVLNVGMLLQDSEVAKEVRSRLLDVAHDAENGQGNINTVISELNEEKQLMLDRMEAEYNGDYDKVCEINAKLFALKNKRIKQLEDTINDITIHSLTIEESTKVINRLVRHIAIHHYNGQFSKVWNDFYSKVNYKLGINIKARKKKKNDSYLSTLNENEMFKVEEMVRVWANRLGVDINKALEIA